MDRPEIPLFVLSAIALVGIVILSVLNHAVPDILNVVAGASALGGAAALSPKQAT